MDNKEAFYSWFCVLNNPREIYSGEPNEVTDKALGDWISDKPTRTGAVAFCISADGLEHLHMVLEDSNKARFSAVKNAFPKAHLEPTKGTKEQAEDYIYRRGKFAEKNESVLYTKQHGEIRCAQGKRNDLDLIQDFIEQGMTPREIMSINIKYRRFEKMIKDHYYEKRKKETPIKREVKVFWHIGETGCGKSYEHVLLSEEHGEDEVYFMTEYKNGFDMYNGERILFMDEFRGQIQYNQLLTVLDDYKSQVSARYSNIVALWYEVHVTSVLPPEKVYQAMVESNRNIDTVDQLKRRIDFIVYHQKIGEDYSKDVVPMSEYTDYETLISNYEKHWEEIEVENLPF